MMITRSQKTLVHFEIFLAPVNPSFALAQRYSTNFSTNFTYSIRNKMIKRSKKTLTHFEIFIGAGRNDHTDLTDMDTKRRTGIPTADVR